MTRWPAGTVLECAGTRLRVAGRHAAMPWVWVAYEGIDAPAEADPYPVSYLLDMGWREVLPSAHSGTPKPTQEAT